MNYKVTEIAKVLSVAAEAITDIYNKDDYVAEIKADNSPVTRADKTSSRIINRGIHEIYPGVPVLDEETSEPEYNIRKKWPSYFLLDPLDGTKEFIKKNGEFCINLAIIENSLPVEGWIYQPLKKRGWYCKRGEGIFSFNEDLQFEKVNKKERKVSTLRIVTSRSFFKPLEAAIIEEIKKNYQVEIVHRGSSLKQIDLILGNSDMYLKAGPCSEWDTAPGQLMVEEFGGVVLKQEDFLRMEYNKPSLINPHFVMLNSQLNTADFIQFMQTCVNKFK